MQTEEKPVHTDGRNWRNKMFRVIFEADTPIGKAFDITLIFTIIASISVVMLDSIQAIQDRYSSLLSILEWVFTGMFTIEYTLRLICTRHPLRYAKSFFGIVDLLAILPNYLLILIPGGNILQVIRVLRLLRIFRILKLASYIKEAQHLARAINDSRRKILVFLLSVFTLVIILGSLMYVIESGTSSKFTSIPRSIYWAIVTMTTVGYGDISPQTNGGQVLASLVMILGYSMLAVPTGIVTVEFAKGENKPTSKTCPNCLAEGHDCEAVYCKFCGNKLN